MHEYALIQALLDQIEMQAEMQHARCVRRVEIEIGELAGVDAELLRRAFDTFTPKTICEGAVLRLELVPADWRCPRCGRPFAPGSILRCPDCATPAELVAGDEIVLARLELEVSDV